MAEVEVHKFSEKSAPKSADITGLKRVTDRYTTKLEKIFEQAAGAPVDVTAGEAGFLEYASWVEELPPLVSLSIFRLLPLRGALFLHLPEGLISSLVEVHFGGQLGPGLPRRKEEFRSTEIQLVGRLSQLLAEQLGSSFGDGKDMKAVPLTHESTALYLTICEPREQIIRQPYTIAADKDLSWQVELIYSAEAGESALEMLETKVVEKDSAPDPLWQQRWADNLEQVRLPLRTILAQPTMSLPQLFEMKVGDVIPITPRAKPPLFVANHKFATGTLGEKNGCAAYKIDQIGQG